MKNARQFINSDKRRGSVSLPIYVLGLLLLMLVSPVMAGKPNFCDKNQTHPRCIPDDGGNGPRTQHVPLKCSLSDFRTPFGDTLLGDGLGLYIDGELNAVCYTWDDLWPGDLAPIILNTTKKGRKHNIRKLDLDLRPCTLPDDPSGRHCTTELEAGFLPPSLFESGYHPNPPDDDVWNFSQMEFAWIGISPYRNDPAPDYFFEHGTVYPMGLHIATTDNVTQTGFGFIINLSSEVAPGTRDNPREGAWCGGDPRAATSDVNVWVGDEVGEDGLPDRYIVTTGTFSSDWVPVDPFKSLTQGPMRASICSWDGPDSKDCSGDASDGTCNYLGEVELQFTIDMTNK